MQLPTSTAILIGSVIIAVAVFFGLQRSQPAPVVPAPVTATPVAVVPISPRETVARQAVEALAYQRTTLRTRCPVPAAERHAFVLNVTFDAQGVELAHGIAGASQTPRPELAGCVSGALAPLRVPPPGATTMVEIPLELP